jgi:anti-sigma factor RsiW
MTSLMGHLGDQAAAFVDGELDHDTRDRVMAHLTRCAACRAEVNAQRLVKSRLKAMSETPPPPSLLAALHRMAEPGEPVRPPRRGPGETTRPPTVPVGGRPAGRSTSRRPTRGHRLRTVAVVGAAAVVATFATAFAVGGEPAHRGTAVTPDVGQYVLDHAATSHGLPFSDLPAGAVGVSYHPRSQR